MKTPVVTFSRYPFVYLLTFLIAGILLQERLSSIRAICWLTLTIAFLGAGAVLHLAKGTGSRIRQLRMLCLLICFSFLGCLLSVVQDIRYSSQWYGYQLNKASAFLIKVNGEPAKKTKTFLIPAAVKGAMVNGHPQTACGDILLYLYVKEGMSPPKAGSRILIPNRLTPIANSGNPFAFDYAAYLRRDNIFHQAFLSPDSISVLSAPEKPGYMARLRHYLIRSIRETITDSATASLAEATLLNERAMLENTLWQAYSVTGIAHIIAISGMHVSILFGILLFLLKWIRNKRLEWIKYIVALPLVWMYIMLTGFPPSAVRAAVMFSLLALRMKLGAVPNNINMLAATGFILLAYHPGWLYDTGVQLSFTAVLSIFLFYGPIKKCYRPACAFSRYAWEMIAVSLAAQVLIFPLVIYYFHQFPVWVLLANIPATIYSFLLMIGSLLIFLLHALSLPCLWLGQTLICITQHFHRIIFFLAGHTPVAARRFYLDRVDFWLLLLAVACCSYFALFRKRLAIFAGTGLLCILTALLISHDYAALKQTRIIVYNSPPDGVIDYFYGKKHQSLGIHNHAPGNTSFRYNILPAQLGYRATAENDFPKREYIWRIQNKTLLYLSQNFKRTTTRSFPLDILILSDSCDYSPGLWIGIFHPKVIVLDASFPRKKAQKWKIWLAAWGVTVHNVREEGAWQLPADEL